MEEERGPVTWDEQGRMVPLDQAQSERLRRAAEEVAAGQPKLADSRIMTHKEYFYARCLELARGLDAIVKPGEGYWESVVFALGGILLIFFLRISVYWPVLAGIVFVIAAFRLWVRLVVQRKGFR